MVADARIESYAEAIVRVAGAEGELERVEDELHSVGQALASSDELRMKLSDASVPAGVRQQIVEDLLGGHASDTTTAVVSMVVGAGRAGQLPAIISRAIELTAAQRNQAVAEVRSAIPLTDDQKARLVAALKRSTGKDVTVKVVIDPKVLGGVVTQIGDEVIDGSVRGRLSQLREAF